MPAEVDDTRGTIGLHGDRIRVEVRWICTETLEGQLICDQRFTKGASLPLVLDSGYRYLTIMLDDDNRFRAFERHG